MTPTPDHDTPGTDDPCICSAHRRHSDCGRDAYTCPCYGAKLAAAVTRAEQAEARADALAESHDRMHLAYIKATNPGIDEDEVRATLAMQPRALVADQPEEGS